MDSIFLDTNCFIDLVENRDNSFAKKLEKYRIAISSLSVHILAYVYKHEMPSAKLKKLLTFFEIAALDHEVVAAALEGPTNDFEDNIQLHGAKMQVCQIFLTNDKKLLKLKSFEQVKIMSPDKLD